MSGYNGSASRKRCHIVLVPGFGGFDALGKVEYYAGVTRIFQHWKVEKPAVLHYFDNLPAAAVVTRAARLRSYLAKRMARGEILPADDLTLVGHSTGGLDIRQLVSDLHNDEAGEIQVDGGIPVRQKDIREMLRRVVFLSVPHWGTNIADWVKSHRWLRRAVVTELQGALAGSQFYLLDEIEDGLAGAAAELTDADMLRAAKDALTEANERHGDSSPQRRAAAHEAASELALYLHDMSSDFHAIEDLTALMPDSGPNSPAHFTRRQREREFKRWQHSQIDTLSFATIGKCPYRFEPGHPAPVWNLESPGTYPEIAKDDRLSEGTDVSYRICYRACAGGPFERPAQGGHVTRRMSGAPVRPLEVWDNDGIVNTLSMLWPTGENVLVASDHLDIVGQYRLVEAARGQGREYQSYDCLKSDAKFSDATFAKVWTEILDFCMGKKRPVAVKAPARSLDAA